MKFRFFPKEEVDFSIENFLDREFMEIIYEEGPNRMYWAFIKENEDYIRTGTTLPCILVANFIGTCTPFTFVFPSISDRVFPFDLARPKDMRPMMANGTIIAYEPAKSITIKGTSGKVIALEVSADAKTRGAIQEGARAMVMYKKEGDKMVAYSIFVVPTPKKRKE